MHRVLCLAALAVVFMLSSTGSAAAASLLRLDPLDAATPITMSGAKAEPQDTTAGAHSRFDVEFTVNGTGEPTTGDPIRDLRLDLPSGLLGAITSADECSFADLAAGACAPETKLGSVEVDLSFMLYFVSGGTRSAGTQTPQDMRNFGSIYRIPARGAEPARLGIVITPALCVFLYDPECKFPTLTGPPVVLESPVAVRTAGDGGLSTAVKDIPKTVPMNTAGTAEIDLLIKTMRIRLHAASGRGDAFMVNPTTCVPAVTKLEVTTYAGATAEAAPSFTPTGCENVPFDPTIAVGVDAAGADLPTGVTVDVGLPYSDDPAALAQTQPREAIVKLPAGLELSPSIGSGGLEGCTDAQFNRDSAGPSACPAGSQIGTVRFSSPLIADPVAGKVFLATPTPGSSPLRIFIVAEQSGAPDALRIKLAGSSDPDPQTGQVTTILSNIPPLTFTEFRLQFRGGQHAVFSTPRTCGTYTTTTSFAPHSGNAPKTPSTTFDVAGDCPDPAAFTPEVGVASAPTQAGSYAALQQRIVRPDRQARMRGLKLSLPPGLLGKLPGVAQCPLEAARVAQCGAATQVGTVAADAGPGPAPLRVNGPVYLSQSIDGSFASLAIVVPARVGPIDLGTTVTLARLIVRPEDQGLDVYADEIPLRQGGVAFSLRALNLSIDRPGFTIAPTSCDPLPVRATLTSDLGAQAPATTTYQATGCDQLPFSPDMDVQLRGKRERMAENGNPSLEVKVTQPEGQGGLKAVEVMLPEGIATDPRVLGQACTAPVFAAGQCPQASVVGHALAVTPLLGKPLRGDVLFVAQATGGLPDLRVRLRGELSVDLIGKVRVAPNGQLITRFEGIPDVPIKVFNLRINGGRTGLLVSTQDMCQRAPTLDAKLLSHSGATSEFTRRIGIPVCRASQQVRISSLRDGRPALRLRVAGGPRNVQTVRMALPRGLTFDTRRARRLIRLSTSGMSSSARRRAQVRVTPSGLTITLPDSGADTVNVLVGKGALRAAPSLRRQGKPRLRFRVSVTQPGLEPRTRVSSTQPIRSVTATKKG